jgi:hypothetical protein
MHEIDFLPVEYRQKHAQQRLQSWRVLVALLFAALLGAASLAGYRHRQRLTADLEAIRPLHDDAVSRSARLADLQSLLKAARAESELYTYLRHPWPRTQILAALLAPLPDEIVFEQVQIRPESPNNRNAGVLSAKLESKAEEQEQSKLPPAARDLKRLRGEADAAQIMVTVTGQASDGAALHRYLGELGKSDLFLKVQLRSAETEKADRSALRFIAAILVRPGYGQPGGPAPNNKKPQGAAAQGLAAGSRSPEGIGPAQAAALAQTPQPPNATTQPNQ